MADSIGARRMNRRGFIGTLSGLVTWAKNGFSVSPAASAVQPPCKPGATLDYIMHSCNTVISNPRNSAVLQGIESGHGYYMGIPRTGHGLEVKPATVSQNAVFMEDRLWFVHDRAGVLHAVMAKRAQEARVLVDGGASFVG